MSIKELVKKELFKSPSLIDLIMLRWVWRTPDWHLVVEGSGLGFEVQGCIISVVKKTRLWRAEKTGIAEELVTHFQDGIEAGVSAEKMLLDFGDIKSAAKMLRRAKIRQRGIVFKGYQFLCRSLGGFVVLYLVAGIYYAMGSPDVKTDYLAEINAVALGLAEEDRAWPLYREGVTGFGYRYYDDEAEDVTRMRGLFGVVGLGDKDWEKVKSYLKGHAEDVEMLRAGALKDGLGYVCGYKVRVEDEKFFGEGIFLEGTDETIVDQSLIHLGIPQLMVLLATGDVLISDMLLAGESGDSVGVISRLRGLMKLSHQISEVPFVICEYAALSKKVNILKALANILEQKINMFSGDELREIAHLLAGEKGIDHLDLRGDRALIYDLIQRMYTDDGNGDGRISSQAVRVTHGSLVAFQAYNEKGFMDSLVENSYYDYFTRPLMGQVVASRRETTLEIDALFDAEERKFRVPLYEDSKPSDEWISLYKLYTNPPSMARFSNWVMLLMTTSSQTDLNFSLGREYVERFEGVKEGVLFGVALELYRRKHGGYPKVLADLSLGYFPVLPVDRRTGEDLRYRLIDGRPVVYGVGLDGDDDGGCDAVY